MKDSFCLSLLLVGVAAGLPSAPSMAAWSKGTVRADPWVVRFGLEGQRLYGRRFEFQVTRRLRGGGDDEPTFPVDEANLAASGAGEGGFVERLKGSLARLMCMMPQEQDGRSSAPTLAASAESEEDEREHIRFAAVAQKSPGRMPPFVVEAVVDLENPEDHLLGYQDMITDFLDFENKIPLFVEAIRRALGNTATEALYQVALERILLARNVDVSHESRVFVAIDGQPLDEKLAK